MTSGQQSQDRTVVLERDRVQIPMAERDDRRGARVVRIGLVLAALR
jgi:hypothetical protein